MKPRTKTEEREEAFRKYELNKTTLISKREIETFCIAFNAGWDRARKSFKENNSISKGFRILIKKEEEKVRSRILKGVQK